MNATPGEKWSRHSYGKVVGLNLVDNTVIVQNETGFEWQVGMPIFEKEFKLATPFQKEEKLNQTDLIRKIEENQRIAMTVNFNKQVDEKTVADKVEGMIKEGKVPTRRTLLKRVRELLVGEERTMVGRHSGAKDDRGRLHFTDMDKGPRLVDPRTINWAIIDGVKYVKK